MCLSVWLASKRAVYLVSPCWQHVPLLWGNIFHLKTTKNTLKMKQIGTSLKSLRSTNRWLNFFFSKLEQSEDELSCFSIVIVVVLSIISKPVHVFLIKVTALTLCSDLHIVIGKISKPAITAHFSNKWELFTTQYFQLFLNNFVYVCVCVYICGFDLTFPLCNMLFACLNKMKTINQIMYPASFNTVPPLNHIYWCFFLL